MYEYALDYYDASRMWDILQKYKVTIFYTTTVLIIFMNFGNDISKLLEKKNVLSLIHDGKPRWVEC